jgi:hypothetical protein
VTFELAVHRRVIGKLREQQVRCGHQCTHIFLMQCGQGIERLRNSGSAVVYARNEVTVQIDDGERRLGRAGHVLSLGNHRATAASSHLGGEGIYCRHC